MTGGGITLEQARRHIGCGVVYRTGYGPAEDGEIVRVNDRFVFVLYRGDRTPKATRPDDLTFLAGAR